MRIPIMPCPRLRSSVVAFGLLITLASARTLAADFAGDVQPFLKKHCLGCHNDKNTSGGLNLKTLNSDQDAVKVPDLLERVHARLAAGDMPPKPLPRPNREQQDTLVAWLESTLKRIDAEQKPDAGRVTARRLNRVEYNNTVRDLLGVKVRPADDFPGDDSGYGFDNIGDVLSLSPVLMEKYMNAAWTVAKEAVVLPGTRLKPTKERVALDGSIPGQPTVLRPRVREIDLDLPATGEYKLVARLKDNRRNRMEGAELRFRFANQPEAKYAVKGVRNADNQLLEYEMQVRATQGLQRIRLEILDASGVAREITDPKDTSQTLALNSVEIYGPYNGEVQQPHASHKALFVCPEKTPACAAKIIDRVATRAFRRPVTADEKQRLTALASKVRKQGGSFEESIQVVLQAVLVSPHFLFRVERDPVDASGERFLNDWELASRLSYFLWSTMPDEALFAAAREGRLSKPEGLRAEVKRMLADEKANSLVTNFAGQWLQLRNLRRHQPAKELFPSFDGELREAMLRETEMFLEALMREDRSVVELLNGKYTYLNEKLAKHYGITDVKGPEFRRVSLDGTQRSGVLTQASILTISSYETRTSPVIRGVWVLNNLLGTPPPPPPPDVPELEAGPGKSAKSLREKLQMHRENAVCAACHAKFDPLGFGLENYDAIGRWREKDGDAAIDASGVLPDGRQFTGPAELKEVLSQDGRLVARTMASKMLTYALGRGLERYDRPAVEEITNRAQKDDYRFSALVEGVVESLPFRKRRMEPPTSKEISSPPKQVAAVKPKDEGSR